MKLHENLGLMVALEGLGFAFLSPMAGTDKIIAWAVWCIFSVALTAVVGYFVGAERATS